MAIQTVRAKVNGTWHSLTYNSATSKWEGTITAPGATSFHQAGGYYPVEIEAVNTAGTSATASAAELEALKLTVRETIAPVITILSPTGGAAVTNNRQPVVFTVVDETGGSGIALGTLSLEVDGVVATGVATTAITNGYSCTLTPATLSDGSHTVTVDVKDCDGNAAAQKSVTFKVDTVPPVLNIVSPTEGKITAAASLAVSGSTNDAVSSPVTVKIKLGSAEQGAVTVNADGTFTKIVTLAEGANTITVTATDAAGKASTVTRNVTLDTSVPVIQSATIAPNPVDAGASMLISVVIA